MQKLKIETPRQEVLLNMHLLKPIKIINDVECFLAYLLAHVSDEAGIVCLENVDPNIHEAKNANRTFVQWHATTNGKLKWDVATLAAVAIKSKFHFVCHD